MRKAFHCKVPFLFFLSVTTLIVVFISFVGLSFVVRMFDYQQPFVFFFC